MKKRTRAIPLQLVTLLLLLSTVIGTLVGCGNKNQNSTSTKPETTTNREIEPDVPQFPQTADYGGRSFRIMHRTNLSYEFQAVEYNGKRVNDVVYARNTAIEERYGVLIENLTYHESWDNLQFSAVLTTQMNAGEDFCDLIAGDQHYIVPTIINDWYLPWQDIPYINLEAAEWQNGITNAMTISGRSYAITGDIALSFWKYMSTIVFNKGMAVNYCDENLYDVVNDKRWTIEYMMELASKVGGEFNAEPVYGFASDWDVAVDAFQTAFHAPTMSTSENGELYFTVMNDKMLRIVDTVTNLYTAEYSYVVPGEDPSKNQFSANQVLFNPMRFEMIERLKSVEFEYGIIPYPMWDTAQGEYCTAIADGVSMMLVSKYTPDTDFVGLITAAMADESRKKIVPEYYEIVLKGQSTKDEQSQLMLDLIRNSMFIDPGYVMLPTAGLVLRKLVTTAIKGEETLELARCWEERKTTGLQKLNDIIKFYAQE